ncbi:protein kinase domain-containing protein [Deinococcus maricopensis]|uniref:non-specific serine/threonine protein kinase n=1 Tax=Deinococcus maricopensis (strain DSM 21211 / LMG 22137 / NRRL B-23946 / LB-34) TaxID=709986 RepID=E8U7B6_DEIML|nr:protein kinase [Deinococcus maricopensis]ADV66955.1 serine/threonine protein kinase [Deinococcus maricopensis DSM 21211]
MALGLLLLLSLFVAALLLLLRVPERVLAVAWAVLAVAVAAALVFLGGANRAQGTLVAAAALAGGALVPLGPLAFRRRGNKAAPRRPMPRTPKTPTTVTDVSFREYDVLDRIGIGGMGSVYRARRKTDGRTVALKVPQEKYLADAKFVKRFYREAEVLKRFDHTNIVRVYDYKATEDEHYIAMEYLDGDSLEALLEERQFGFSESVQILRALSDALRHIHAANIVHRDIKPANVMVLRGALDSGKLREGGVKLMDFGIAVGKVLTRLTMTGARVGTPIYMAPEQAKGNRVDARSDVYSLGLLMYEMVTGQTAFKGSYEAVVHQQVFESPKPPKQVRLEVPGKLNDLILNMIEKDPAARPTLDNVIARIDAGLLGEDAFTDPVALAMSVQEKRGTLRLLDLQGKLRASLRDTGGALPTAPNALASIGEFLYATVLEYRSGKQDAPLVRKMDQDGRELAAFGTYGLGPEGLLHPISIAVHGDLVHVLDAETVQVVTYDAQGRFVRRVGGRGSGQGTFERPRALAAASNGDLLVLDTALNEVQRLRVTGEYVTRYAFRKDRNSDELRPLDGLGVDAAGGVYIVDALARKVRKIDADGAPGQSFTLESMVGEPNDAPWLMQVDARGQLYAARQGGQMLRIFSTGGDLVSSRDMYAPVQAMALIERQPR